MTSIDYHDFDLHIERTPQGYRARGASSFAGEATTAFSIPFSSLELENFLLRVGRTRRGIRRLDSPEVEAAKAFGKRLFTAVFNDELRSCLRTSLEEARQTGAGLRIRLRLTDAPELADVPWEYLYDPTTNRFLALSVDTPLVRYLELPEYIRPLTVAPPLHVLAMIASPADYPPLNVEREWSLLQQAMHELEQRGLVTLERLERATLSALQRRLRRGTYHILHFIGHGGYQQEQQDGVLILENEDGRGTATNGQYLGTLLHDHRPLRLAILNACEGARTSTVDPFAGTAQSLVQQGIPAVIAMQFEITDDAAITFAQEFYGAVADGYPIDAALAEARKSIFAQGNGLEWGTPVLYLRAPNGRIFDVTQGRPPAVGQQPVEATGLRPLPVGRPKQEDSKRKQQLASLYTESLSAFYTGRWDQAVALLTEIVAQQADYEDAASKLAEAKQQLLLAQHYAAGLAAYQALAWEEAISQLTAVVSRDANYADAPVLLENARRRKALADLYADAQRLHAAQDWQAVIDVFKRINALDAKYLDPQGLLTAAKEALRRREQDEMLGQLYGQGVRHIAAGAWSEALAVFEHIHELRPGYREEIELRTRVQRELAQRQSSAPAQTTAPPGQPQPSSQAGVGKRGHKPGWPLWVTWSLATTIGLALGIVPGFTIGTAIAPKTLFTYGFAFACLAAFVGASVAVAQSLVLQRTIPSLKGWIQLSVVGWIVGGVAGGMLSRVLQERDVVGYAVQVGVFGGLIGFGSAAAQWWRLRQHAQKAFLWILVNAIGWMIISAFPYIIWSDGLPSRLVLYVPLWLLVAVLVEAIAGAILNSLLRYPLPVR